MPAGAPVVRPNGEIWMYYNANRFGGMSLAEHVKYDNGKELFRLGIGAADFECGSALALAKLRPEGFCSLEADVQGTLLTKPFQWPRGKALFVNADARFGEIYCEVTDVKTGVKPLLGFGRRLGGPLTGDYPHGTKVEWLGRPQAGWAHPVRLKVYMVQARLFSFWLADD